MVRERVLPKGAPDLVRCEIRGGDRRQHSWALVRVDDRRRRRVALDGGALSAWRRSHHRRLVHFNQTLVVAAELSRHHNICLQARLVRAPANLLQRRRSGGARLLDWDLDRRRRGAERAGEWRQPSRATS